MWMSFPNCRYTMTFVWKKWLMFRNCFVLIWIPNAFSLLMNINQLFFSPNRLIRIEYLLFQQSKLRIWLKWNWDLRLMYCSRSSKTYLLQLLVLVRCLLYVCISLLLMSQSHSSLHMCPLHRLILVLSNDPVLPIVTFFTTHIVRFTGLSCMMERE